MSWNLGTLTSWNPLGHSRPSMGLIYFYTPLQCAAAVCTNTLAVLLPCYPFIDSQNIEIFHGVRCEFDEIICGKKCNCDSRKLIFRLILHPTALCEVSRSCTTSWQFAALWFPKQSFANPPKWQPRISFRPSLEICELFNVSVDKEKPTGCHFLYYLFLF